MIDSMDSNPISSVEGIIFDFERTPGIEAPMSDASYINERSNITGPGLSWLEDIRKLEAAKAAREVELRSSRRSRTTSSEIPSNLLDLPTLRRSMSMPSLTNTFSLDGSVSEASTSDRRQRRAASSAPVLTRPTAAGVIPELPLPRHITGINFVKPERTFEPTARWQPTPYTDPAFRYISFIDYEYDGTILENVGVEMTWEKNLERFPGAFKYRCKPSCLRHSTTFAEEADKDEDLFEDGGFPDD